MALDHRRLIRPGKKIRPNFLRSTSLLYKILPTNHHSPITIYTGEGKGGMSLRNGMWHGLWNEIIMQNVICAE